jgi:hypothetical protein
MQYLCNDNITLGYIWLDNQAITSASSSPYVSRMLQVLARELYKSDFVAVQ